MDFTLTTLLNFMFLIDSLFVDDFTVYFGPAPTLDENQAGKEAKHTEVVAATSLMASDKENDCRLWRGKEKGDSCCYTSARSAKAGNMFVVLHHSQ